MACFLKNNKCIGLDTTEAYTVILSFSVASTAVGCKCPM